MMETTRDGFLGGRLRIRQPKHGYRAGIDAVFVAAAVPAGAGEHVLELGAGAGVAALCLAARVPGISIAGIEADPALVALASENAHNNDLAARVSFERADVLAYAPARLFDRVFMNPPFNDPRGTQAPDKAKAKASAPATLANWIARAIALTKDGGTVTLILRADREGEALAAMQRGLGAIVVFPLLPRAGEAPKRVLLHGTKGSCAPQRRAKGLILHAPPEKYTDGAEAILRHGRALALA